MKRNNQYHKIVSILLLLYILSINVYAQKNVEIKQINDATYLFTEVKRICDKDNGYLWGTNLFYPALLINGNNRFFVANDSLSIDDCAKEGMYFTGYLPNIYAMSNSTLKVGSKNYASIRYSEKNKFDTSLYVRTFIHEMFHLFMSSNNYDSISYNNPQMDTKNGRIYLQLELLALKKALISNDINRKEAIKEALCFRRKRQSLFLDAKANENNFEMQEGLPTYTEYSLGIFSEKERISTLLNSIDMLINEPSYIRSFGYETGASYAFLNDISKDWRKTVFKENDLSKITMSLYNINNNDIDTANIEKYLQKYDYQSIFLKEDSLENIMETARRNIIDRLSYATLLIVDLEDNSFSMTSGMIQLDSMSIYCPYMNISGPFGHIYSKKDCVMNWKENKCYFFLNDVLLENNKSNSETIEIDINKGWNISKEGRIYKLTQTVSCQ